MKAKKKPVTIDFIEVKSPFNIVEITDWVKSFGDDFWDKFHIPKDSNAFHVKTLEGTSYEVTDNDVIIRGIIGEYYPCKKDIFINTYEVIYNS